MSTLVSILLAAVLQFLGANIQQHTKEVSKIEIRTCNENSQNVADYYRFHQEVLPQQN